MENGLYSTEVFRPPWDDVNNSPWFPVVTARPVLPMEHCSFKVVRPHACQAIRLSWQHGSPVIGIAHGITLRHGHLVGTALQIEACEEIQKEELHVLVVGISPVEIRQQAATSMRVDSGPAFMVNLASVEWYTDTLPTMPETCEKLRHRVLQLMGNIGLALENAPTQHGPFSWWVARSLPLPPVTRAFFLRVTDVEMRLTLCAAVLAPFHTSIPRARL